MPFYKFIKSEEMTDKLYSCFGFENRNDFLAKTKISEEELNSSCFPLSIDECHPEVREDWYKSESNDNPNFVLYIYTNAYAKDLVVILTKDEFIAELGSY